MTFPNVDAFTVIDKTPSTTLPAEVIKAIEDVVLTGTGIFTIGYGRVESKVPNAFRVAQYPDGSKRIQGAYQWQEGERWGVTWRDLPMVQVDAEGNEIGG